MQRLLFGGILLVLALAPASPAVAENGWWRSAWQRSADWPEASGNPMELMRSSPAAAYYRATTHDRDPVQRQAHQAGTPSQPGAGPGAGRGRAAPDRRANEIGIDSRDPEQLLTLIEATLERFIGATGRRR